MTELSWLFLYTPLPWFLAMYILAYRHDLRRIASPLRDRVSKTEWLSVCRRLQLIDDSTRMPADELGRWSWLALIATILMSGFWAMISLPLVWYELAALQVVAALSLLLVLASSFGPFPYKPYKDFLPYPRRGTRIRHIEKRKLDSSGTKATEIGEGSGGEAP